VLAGIDLSGASASLQSAFAGRIGELLNGMPARVWDFTDPINPSLWSERSFAAFVGDTFALSPRVTLNGGMRVETIDGSAEAHSGTIAWRSGADGKHLPLECDDGGRAAAGRPGPARAASRPGQQWNRRLLDDRSGARASVHG
jgi:hypothetical protein